MYALLAAFVLIFILIIVVIQALLAISNKNYGIARGHYDQTYFWTYGPTAVLTAIAALWGRAEYQSKLVAPWVRMSKLNNNMMPNHEGNGSSSDCKKTLMLDYFSDVQIWAIVKAFHNRDFAVFITTTVSIIIKILIVISTGLISLSLTKVTFEPHPMVVQDRFMTNGDAANESLRQRTNLPNLLMHGLLVGELGLPNEGVFDGFAFQSAEAIVSSGSSDSPMHSQMEGGDWTSKVTVDGFQSFLDCELVTDIKFKESFHPTLMYGGSTWRNLTMTHPGCSLDLSLFFPASPNCGADKSPEICQHHFAYHAFLDCRKNYIDRQPDSRSQNDEAGAESRAFRRLLVLFGTLTYLTDLSHPNDSDLYSELEFYAYPVKSESDRLTGMLCTPTHYAIGELEVFRNKTNVLEVHPVKGTWRNDTIKTSDGHLDGWDMMDGFVFYFNPANMHNNLNSRVSNGSVNIGAEEIDVGSSWFTELVLKHYLASRKTGAEQAKLEVLYQRDTFQEAVTHFYRQSTAIIARDRLMEPSPADTTILGSLSLAENRLVIRTWAAQWMAGLAAVCAVLICAAAVTVVPKQGILPCSPATMAGVAILIRDSPDLISTLRLSGAANRESLGQVLARFRFRSGAAQNTSYFSIWNPCRDQASCLFEQVDSPRKVPIVLHPISRLLLCIVIGAIAVALEVLLRVSTRKEGIANIPPEDPYIHYTWTAVPSLLLGCLAMVISSMEFQVRLLAPYITLAQCPKDGYTSSKGEVGVLADKFLNLDLVDLAIPRTIHREFVASLSNFGNSHPIWQHFTAALATTLAFLLASLFTMATASIYRPVSLPVAGDAILQARTTFDSDKLNGSLYKSDLPGVYRASLIVGSNLSYTLFTYEDLVFPELKLLSMSIGNSRRIITVDSPLLQTVIPALRLRPVCRVYPPSAIKTNLTVGILHGQENHSYYNPLSIQIDGESGCNKAFNYSEGEPYIGNDGYYYTAYLDTLSQNRTHELMVNSSEELVSVPLTYFGQSSLRLLAGTTYSPNSFFASCSDILHIWGKMDYSKADSPAVAHVGAIGCNTTVEMVDVEVTFSNAYTFEIDSDNPPVPLEDTARSPIYHSWDGRLGEIATNDGIHGSGLLEIPHSEDTMLHPLFALLTLGSRWAIPLDDLGSPEADDKVIEAILFHHRVVAAQQLTAYRVASNSSNITLSMEDMSRLPGNTTDADVRYHANFTTRPGSADERRRVVQDPTSTRVLQVLLVLVLILLVTGWTLSATASTGTDNVLASSPTTIAALAALVAGGNVLEELAALESATSGQTGPSKDQEEGPFSSESSHQIRTEKDLVKALSPDGKSRFWIGWGNVPEPEGEGVIGGRNEAGASRFGLFIIRPGMEGEEEEVQEEEDVVMGAGQDTAYHGLEDLDDVGNMTRR